LATARRELGEGKLLGASCYDMLARAISAQEGGVDYVAFGAAFPTSTKPGTVRAPLSLYRSAKTLLGVRIVAIGGLTVENALEVVAAGADAAAVIGGLFEAPDVEQRAREFARILGA
jgi:thiamine-phosphate pyrophosphorylase